VRPNQPNLALEVNHLGKKKRVWSNGLKWSHYIPVNFLSLLPGQPPSSHITSEIYCDLPSKTNTMLLNSFKTSLHGSFTLVHSAVDIRGPT